MSERQDREQRWKEVRQSGQGAYASLWGRRCSGDKSHQDDWSVLSAENRVVRSWILCCNGPMYTAAGALAASVRGKNMGIF